METDEIPEITLDEDEPKPKISPDFNIFVGAETGLLKGVSINPKLNLAKNFSNMHSLERKHEITAMSWGNDEEQNEILLGKIISSAFPWLKHSYFVQVQQCKHMSTYLLKFSPHPSELCIQKGEMQNVCIFVLTQKSL